MKSKKDCFWLFLTKRLLILCLVPMLIAGCEAKIDNTPRDISDRFMKQISTGDINNAYEELFSQKEQPVDAETFLSFTNGTYQFIKKNGRFIEYKILSTDNFSGMVYKTQYIFKQQSRYSIWTFYFVSKNAEWKLWDIKFTDQLQLVL